MPSFKLVRSEETRPGQVWLIYSDGQTERRIPQSLVTENKPAAATALAGVSGRDQHDDAAIRHRMKFPGTARLAGTGNDKHFEVRNAAGQVNEFRGGYDKGAMERTGYGVLHGPTREEGEQDLKERQAIAQAMADLDRLPKDQYRIEQAKRDAYWDREEEGRAWDEYDAEQRRANPPMNYVNARDIQGYDSQARSIAEMRQEIEKWNRGAPTETSRRVPTATGGSSGPFSVDEILSRIRK